MKTRNGLLFALCVLAGAAGFTACSESGSVEEEAKITVDPSSLTLEAGDTGSFNVTYLANANISVESNNTDCVTVASPVNTGADNKGKVDVSAAGSNCNADITVSADNGNVKGTVKVTVNAAPAGPFISLSDSKLKLSAGETDKVTATFANGENPIKGEQLVLENSDSSCVDVADKTSATGANGKVDISVTAKDKTCEATITVKKPDGFDGDVKAKSFTVSVKADGEEPSTQTPVLEFDDEAVSMNGDSDETVKAGAKLYYKENKVGIASTTINVSTGNNKCVKSKESSYTTGTDGKFNVELVRTGTKCDTIITASVDANTKATLAVSVTDANEIVIKRIDVKANSKYDKMGWSTLVLLDGDGVTCDVAMAELSEYAVWDDAFVDPKNSAGEAPLVASFKAKDLKEDATAIKIDVTQHKGILAFASASDESEDVILGAGCTPISKENNNTVVDIVLEPIPTNIKGTYTVYSNFDLTSAFEYSGSLSKVENMKGGDWVYWTKSLFDDPVKALWEFIWVNTLQRISEINFGSEQVNSAIKLVFEGLGKDVAGGYVRPLIEGYLKEYKWYQVIKEVSPDVSDLMANMQFKGKIEVKDASGLQINNATETFTSLQYQWSSSDIATNGCLDEELTYGKSKCRKGMTLSASGNAVTGSWNGAINDESLPAGVDGELNINSHSLTFKWASILYATVFGEILPTALDYKNNKNVQNGRYLSAFLDKLLFESIVKYYNDKCVGKTKCSVDVPVDDEGNPITQEDAYPALSQTDVTMSCERFIEAIVYMVYAKASSLSGVIASVAKLACGDQGLGKLDEWVDTSLSKLEGDTANQLTLKADKCSLYDEGTTDYQKMGQPDDPIYTANDVFKSSSKVQSARCEWDITLPSSVSLKPIKGLFHAYRDED